MIAVLLESPAPSEGFWHKTVFDPTICWVFVTALGTIALVIVGYYQLAELVKTRKSQHADELHASFLTPRTRAILLLLQYHLLVFVNVSQFAIEPLPEQIVESSEVRRYLRVRRISAFEIIRLILNPLEYIAYLVEVGQISLNQVVSLFGLDIRTVGSDEAIWRFILALRQEHNNPYLFSKFEKLYEQMRRRLAQ